MRAGVQQCSPFACPVNPSLPTNENRRECMARRNLSAEAMRIPVSAPPRRRIRELDNIVLALAPPTKNPRAG